MKISLKKRTISVSTIREYVRLYHGKLFLHVKMVKYQKFHMVQFNITEWCDSFYEGLYWKEPIRNGEGMKNTCLQVWDNGAGGCR